MTDLTRKREALLKNIADQFALHLALLVFIDHTETDVGLLCAYAFTRDDRLAGVFENQIHYLRCGPGYSVDDDLLLSETDIFIEKLGLQHHFPDAVIARHVLTTDCAPFDYDCAPSGAKKIGVLVIAAPDGGRAVPATDLDQLATEISVGRFERFISTVLCTQNNVSATSGSLDDTIRDASVVFARELGARGFLYRNKNKEHGWSAHWVIPQDDDQEPGTTNSIPAQTLNAASDLSDEDDLAITRRPRHGERLEVTLRQRSFEIRNVSFCRPDALAASLREVRSEAIGISFRQKNDPGYLQQRFSETDQRIASAVYNNLQNFAELKLSDESSANVFSALHGSSLTLSGSAEELLSTLRQLSIVIDNVHIVTVDLGEKDIALLCSSGDPALPIDSRYLERVRLRYLSGFYHGSDSPDWGRMAVGMDANDDHYYLEVHTPRQFSDSQLYIISFSERFVAQATLQALTNLFGELFTRMKEEDFLQARSNNATQTRHAVNHQFAAALHGMQDIKNKWDRAVRNQDYWLSLLEDPVFPESIDWAYWSLNQAQLILDNGRFLISDIDPKSIARKSFNILQVITDSQKVFRILARRKLLKFSQRIRGKAPTVSTGDEALMRVAITNLMDNAVKYSLNGATVEWELIYRPDRYQFRISNRGDPISPDSFNLLLQIGFRGRQKDHLNIRPGTGLGLPITHRILKAHSQSSGLHFESDHHRDEIGGATNTFYFEMPYLTGLSNTTAS